MIITFVNTYLPNLRTNVIGPCPRRPKKMPVRSPPSAKLCPVLTSPSLGPIRKPVSRDMRLKFAPVAFDEKRSAIKRNPAAPYVLSKPFFDLFRAKIHVPQVATHLSLCFTTID